MDLAIALGAGVSIAVYFALTSIADRVKARRHLMARINRIRAGQ